MKTSISMPDKLLRAADLHARVLGASRSELLQRALKKFLHDQEIEMRDSLDRVYSNPRNRTLDPAIRVVGESMIMDENW
jgi:metal-responsive CopG/Arc/MetJ family transcriptional regulator